MPNRIIKESIHTSKSVNAMTDFQFRLWVNLITYVDDYGRGSADPELIKGFVFPRRKRLTETDIAKGLDDLAGMGCIRLYEVDGESYFCFPNWSLHQRIQTKHSRFPEPIHGDSRSSTVTHGDSRSSTVTHGDSPSESESEKESESESKTEERRARYGEYQNVLLSDGQYEKLRAEFPQDYEKRIEAVSTYCQSTGKVYRDYLATIRSWARRDAERARSEDSGGSFDTDAFFEAAVERGKQILEMDAERNCDAAQAVSDAPGSRA